MERKKEQQRRDPVDAVCVSKEYIQCGNVVSASHMVVSADICTLLTLHSNYTVSTTHVMFTFVFFRHLIYLTYTIHFLFFTCRVTQSYLTFFTADNFHFQKHTCN